MGDANANALAIARQSSFGSLLVVRTGGSEETNEQTNQSQVTKGSIHV